VVESFKYLGSTENNVASMSDEIDICVQRWGRHMSIEAIVLSTALYGSATWNISVKKIERLEAKQFHLIRRMLGFFWKEFISYEKLMELAKAFAEKIVHIEGRIRMVQYIKIFRACRE